MTPSIGTQAAGENSIALRGVEPARQRAESFALLKRYLTEKILRYSPYYRRIFAECRIDPDRISTAEEYSALVPLTRKDDLREHGDSLILSPAWPGRENPQGCEPIEGSHLSAYFRRGAARRSDGEPPQTDEELAYREFLLDWQPLLFTRTGGSTGRSVEVAYTRGDLDGPFYQSGLLHHVIRTWAPVQRFMPLTPAGEHLGFYGNVIGALVQGQPLRPTFGGRVMPTEDQVVMARRVRAQALQSTPSYLAHWLEVASELAAAKKIDGLPDVEVVMVAGEALSDRYRRIIKRRLEQLGAGNAPLIQGMSSTELKGPGFRECDEGYGLHVHPGNFFIELLDPETLAPAAPGRPGVLVWSHIGWHGTAILRYWSGDVIDGGATWDACPGCGLTVPRLHTPIRRLELDFIKVRGARVDLVDLRAELEAVLGRDRYQVVIRPNSTKAAATEVLAYIDDAAKEDAARHAVRIAADLRIDHVIVCTGDELRGRLYASGWKPRWLVREDT